MAKKARKAAARKANLEVHMTCSGPFVETDDPDDRAHDQRDDHGFLKRASAPGVVAKPRMYSTAYMMTRKVKTRIGEFVEQVSFESQFEDIAARERRLEEMGLFTPADSIGLATRWAMAMRESGR